MNELTQNLARYEISYQPAVVNFLGFDELKQSATKLADRVSQVEVTEENIKESKKLLATINKEMKNINTQRITLKKGLLKPYEDVEQKVKEIENIIVEANGTVSRQIKELEEIEREEKRKDIEEIFDRRVKHYPMISEHFDSEDFIEEYHLNKSITMSKVEDEMVKWLEKTKTDIIAIGRMNNSAELLVEYIDTKDIALAIQIVTDRKKKVEKVEVKQSQKTSKVLIEINQSDLKFAELLLQENNIKFSIKNN